MTAIPAAPATRSRPGIRGRIVTTVPRRATSISTARTRTQQRRRQRLPEHSPVALEQRRARRHRGFGAQEPWHVLRRLREAPDGQQPVEVARRVGDLPAAYTKWQEQLLVADGRASRRHSNSGGQQPAHQGRHVPAGPTSARSHLLRGAEVPGRPAERWRACAWARRRGPIGTTPTSTARPP